jgi:hypothetical protein
MQTGPSEVPVFRSLIVKTLTTLAVLVASLGFGTLTASPAAAATSTQFCFKWSTGTAYSTQPVYLYQANGTYVKSGKTASNGCAIFTGLSSTRNYYVYAYTTLGIVETGIQVWSGFSPSYTGTGSGQVSIGTGIVYFRGYL